jgi:predicted branched-subunit amino acid permease
MSPSVRRGLHDTAPLAIPIAAFGAVFGVLAVQVGLPPWLVVLSSVIVVSGAAQFAMVALIPVGPPAVIVAAVGLGLRHVPMAATLARMLQDAPLRRRFHLAWVLVDETFGLTVNAFNRGEVDLVGYKTGADLVLYPTWVTSTFVGAFFGAGINPSRWGFGVFFALMFLALAAPLVRQTSDLVTVGASAISAVVAVAILPEAWQVTAAAVAGALVGSRFK